MAGLAIMSIVLGAVWALAAIVALQKSGPVNRPRLAGVSAAVATAQVLAAARPGLAPLTLGAWLVFACALPYGVLGSAARRATAAVGGAAAAAWAATLESNNDHPQLRVFVIAALGVSAVGALASMVRYLKASVEQKRLLRWLATGSVLAATYMAVCLALNLMTDKPQPQVVWLAAGFVFVPVALVFGLSVTGARASATVLIEAIAAAGLAALVVVVYLVVVVGINGSPSGHEREVLLASLAAALVVAALAVPVRQRVIAFAGQLVGAAEPSTDEVVSGFGARMSRAVPMDELMLQLAESLRASVAPAGAEIWTGPAGVLSRTVSVPSLGPGRIELSEQDRLVVGRGRIGGPSWTSVWLPNLTQVPGGDLRAVPSPISASCSA